MLPWTDGAVHGGGRKPFVSPGTVHRTPFTLRGIVAGMMILESLALGDRTPDGPVGSPAWAYPAGTLTHAGRVVGCWFAHVDVGMPAMQAVVTVVCRGREGVSVSYQDLPAMREGLDGLLAGTVSDRGRDTGRSGPEGVGPVADRVRMGSVVELLATHVGLLDPASCDLARTVLVAVLGRDRGGPDFDAHMREVGRVLAPFVATFDPEAIRMLAAHPGRGCLARGYDGLDATMVPGAPLRAALGIVPDLMATLAHAWRVDPRGFAADMAREDPFAPVRRIQATGHKWPRRLLNALPGAYAAHGGMDLPEPRLQRKAGQRPGEDFDPLLDRMDDLRCMPAECIPRDGAGWRAYFGVSHFVSEVGTLCGAHGLPAMLGHVPDWEAWADTTAKAAGVGHGDLLQAVAGVPDVAAAFYHQVLAPALRIAGAEEPARPLVVASCMLHGGRGIASILEASRSWHAHRAAIDAAVRGLPGHAAVDPPWPPALPRLERDGLAVEVLATQADLDAEGADGPDGSGATGLAHCVGGYAPLCRAGTSRILSVRRISASGAYERLSTVEVRFADDGRWRIRQHAGRRNEAPPDAAKDLLAAYESMLRAAPASLDRAGLAAVPEPADHGAGYDAALPGNWEAVRNAWRSHLPRWMRDLDMHALAGMAATPPDSIGWPWIPIPYPEALRAMAVEAGNADDCEPMRP